jgi:type IV secretory pathway VirB2 component (pilin)
MDKLVLLSIVAITIAVPAVAAAERNPARALRKVLVWMVVGTFAYVVAVVIIYPRLLG